MCNHIISIDIKLNIKTLYLRSVLSNITVQLCVMLVAQVHHIKSVCIINA